MANLIAPGVMELGIKDVVLVVEMELIFLMISVMIVMEGAKKYAMTVVDWELIFVVIAMDPKAKNVVFVQERERMNALSVTEKKK